MKLRFWKREGDFEPEVEPKKRYTLAPLYGMWPEGWGTKWVKVEK